MNQKDAKIDLSLHPDVENRVSKITKDYYEQELEGLEPIQEGQVNIHTSYIYDNGDGIEASIIIRNGLKNTINFELLPMIIADEEGNIYFRGTFEATGIGDIPPFKARPWKFFIKKDDLFIKDINNKKLSVKFDAERLKAEVNEPNTIKLIIPEDFNTDERQALIEFINKMPQLEENTVDLDLFQKIHNKEKEEIYLTYVVRNSANQDVKLDYLPYNHEINGVVNRIKLEADNIIIPKRSIRVFRVNLKGLK